MQTHIPNKYLRAVALVCLGLAAGCAPSVPKPDPVVIIMDATATNGVYDEDNKLNGASNVKEVARVLEKDNLLPSRSLHQEPINKGWDNAAYVLSLHPDLLIIHRSAFFHTVNVALGLKKIETPKTEEEKVGNEKWQAVYDECDHKLRLLIGLIGTSEPRTKFLVYSRGTDTQWLAPGFQQEKWIKPLEDKYPVLKGRITTMTIAPGEDGKSPSFRNANTAKALRNHVRTILGLPGNPE